MFFERPCGRGRSSSAWTADCVRKGKRKAGGRGGEGGKEEVRLHGRVVFARMLGWIRTDTLDARRQIFTGADGNNPSADQRECLDDVCGRLDEKDVRTINFTVGRPFRYPYVRYIPF
jgi:hypothetical protein